MPRYYFNIRKDNHEPDVLGVELPDMAAARAEAARALGQDLKDNPDAFWDDEEWEIAVSDEKGLILFTLAGAAYRAAATTR